MHFHYDDEFCTCGWRVVDELDETDLGYEWHTLVVMADTSGRLFWAEGSGCSCNDRTDIEESELAPIDRTATEFQNTVRGFPGQVTDKPRFYAMAGRSRFGVSVIVEGNGPVGPQHRVSEQACCDWARAARATRRRVASRSLHRSGGDVSGAAAVTCVAYVQANPCGIRGA